MVRFTRHCSAAFITASLYFGGKSTGSAILKTAFFSRWVFSSCSNDKVIPRPSAESPRDWMKPRAKMPAQVPSEARKRSNGVGAEPCPPPPAGWSVAISKPCQSALTFFPPGKVIF